MNSGNCEMQQIKTLIDKAVKICGSQQELAKRIDLHQSALSEIKGGYRKIAPELAILIADIAMENIADAALSAIVENNLGTARGLKIQAIVGRDLVYKMMNCTKKNQQHELML